MPRTIKKYANRRLYDTQASHHVTLEGIRQLVVDGEDIVVIDDTNGEDITRSILLQVIAEQEHQPDPILSQEFMVNVIRSYGSGAQTMVGGHLEQALRQFMSQQPQARERKPYVSARPPDEAYKTLSGREATNLPK